MRRRALGAALLLLVVVASCGEEPTATTEPPAFAPDGRSSGFVVDRLPDGFEAPVYTAGTDPATLTNDEVGGVEPYLVLTPDRWTGDPDDVAFVALVDGSGNQGGLEQALPDYLDEHESTRRNGREVWTYPEGTSAGDPDRPTVQETTPQVVERVDGERGVRAWSRTAPIDDLLRLADAATLTDRAAVMTRVPAGWQLASALDAEQLDTLSWLGSAGPGDYPDHAAAGSFVGRWQGVDRQLRVVVLTGASDDLLASGLVRRSSPALDRSDPWRAARADDAWTAERDGDPSASEPARRELTTIGRDGMPVVVSAVGTDLGSLPTIGDLLDVARSVHDDPGGWSAGVAEQAARPPRVIPPKVEIARGVHQGEPWILEGDPSVTGAPGGFGYRLLLRGERAVHSSGGGGDGVSSVAVLDSADDRQPLPFGATLVAVGGDVAAVSLDGGVTRVPTVPAPSGRIALFLPGVPYSGPVFRYDAGGNRLP